MKKQVLVIGGNGSLGKAVVKAFKISWDVTSIDFSKNTHIEKNILLDKDYHMKQLDFKFNDKFDSIICVAGGWEASTIQDKNLLISMNSMMNMCLYSSVLSAHLASLYLKEKGLLCLTGAAAVKNKSDTSFCLSYQLAKQGVENLTNTLFENKSLLPKNSKIVTLCPEVIDTESNRKFMKDADKSNWVTPEEIASIFLFWSENYNMIPKDRYYLV